MEQNIIEIASNFDIKSPSKAYRFGDGLINDTYLVESSKDKYILQKLHPIFKSSVLVDTYNITQYLSIKGLKTPLLVKTKSGKLFFKDIRDRFWRMLTYVPGKCYEKGINSKQAFRAGRLVGQFHNILSGFDYKFKHEIKNFHSSKARLNKLRITLKKFKNTGKYDQLVDSANMVLASYEKLSSKVEDCPDRIIHGDLKINNVRFDIKNNAICLLDLDTLGKHKIATDIASGVRTWCNKADEGDVQNSKFNFEVFNSMLAGYLSTAKFITKKEIKSIPETIERIILTLTARFIVDAFEEKYFRLNPRQYKNLYEQNKTKAFAQLALYKDFVDKRKQINKIIINLCKQ